MLTSKPGLRRCLAALCLVLGAFIAMGSVAHAQAASRFVVVIPVSGLIDPANESLIMNQIQRANAQDAALIVLQLDSRGATDVRTGALVAAVTGSRAPVAAWVGPSGGEAAGIAAELAIAAPVVGMSNGATLGPASPVRLDRPGSPSDADVAEQLGALATRNGRQAMPATTVATRRLGTQAALDAGVIDVAGSTLVEFIGNLDGRTVQTATGPTVLATAKPSGQPGERRELDVRVQLTGLSLAQQLSHALTSPSIAYLLLIAGFALIVFEFFAVSIGIAGVVGAGCLVAAFTGFGHLPMNWWAVALAAFGIFGFAIDVQVGRFGFWSVIGFLAALAGSVFLYGGAPALDPPWWVIAVVMSALVLFMLGGMTGIVRTRFSTPTLGREGLIGTMGTADVAINPDGIAMINGARWTARTNRATPIAAGDAVRVVAVDGFVLEVEPETGGAQDYRERARKRHAGTGEPDASADANGDTPEIPQNS